MNKPLHHTGNIGRSVMIFIGQSSIPGSKNLKGKSYIRWLFALKFMKVRGPANSTMSFYECRLSVGGH